MKYFFAAATTFTFLVPALLHFACIDEGPAVTRATPFIVFSKHYAGGELIDLQAESDGVVVLASQSIPREVRLFKLDALGNRHWENIVSVEAGYSPIRLISTSENSYTIFFKRTASGVRRTDVLALHTDKTNMIHWQRTFSFITYFADIEVQPSIDEGYFMLANFNGALYQETWLTKISSTGNQLWSKQLAAASTHNAWLARPRGESVLVGLTWSSPDSTSILRVDANGNFETARIYPQYFFPEDIRQNAQKNWMSIENFLGPPHRTRLGLLDQRGGLLLEKYPSLSPCGLLFAIEEAPNNGCVLAGSSCIDSSSVNGCLAVTDASGTIYWSKIFASARSSQLSSLERSSETTYYAGGSWHIDSSWVVRLEIPRCEYPVVMK